MKNKIKFKSTTLGFTLLELLAVIVILAIIMAITIPLILGFIEQAKNSSRKSNIFGYADAVRLAIVTNNENTESDKIIPKEWIDNNVSYKGNKVNCNMIYNSKKYDLILHECNVANNQQKYCFFSGRVINCDDDYYLKIYREIPQGDFDVITDENNIKYNLIYNFDDLAKFRDLVNSGQVNLNAKLMSDINLDTGSNQPSQIWEPIGYFFKEKRIVPQWGQLIRNGSSFKTTGNDPKLGFYNDLNSIVGVKIELNSPLAQSIYFELYYATAEDNLSETNTSKKTIPAGTSSWIMTLPIGNWQKLRFDFGTTSNISFNIKKLSVLTNDEYLLETADTLNNNPNYSMINHITINGTEIKTTNGDPFMGYSNLTVPNIFQVNASFNVGVSAAFSAQIYYGQPGLSESQKAAKNIAKNALQYSISIPVNNWSTIRYDFGDYANLTLNIQKLSVNYMKENKLIDETDLNLAYQGIFDGNNKTISYLTPNNSVLTQNNYNGLFDMVSDISNIKNLIVTQ